MTEEMNEISKIDDLNKMAAEIKFKRNTFVINKIHELFVVAEINENHALDIIFSMAIQIIHSQGHTKEKAMQNIEKVFDAYQTYLDQKNEPF